MMNKRHKNENYDCMKSYAYFKKEPDDKEFSACIILKIKVDVLSFWVVAMPEDFTER